MAAESGNNNCGLCLDTFKDPKVLPCCHTFCKPCLERVAEKTRQKGRLICPQCRGEHPIPANGVGGYLNDFTLATDLNVLEESSEAAVCGECDSTDPVVAYCCDCQSYLCDFCSNAHRRMKHCRHHKVVPLESLQQENPLPENDNSKSLCCVTHPTEQLKVYCKTCESLVCCDCIVADHQGHKLGSVDKDTCKEAHSKLKALAVNAEQRFGQLKLDLTHIRKVEQLAIGRPIELKSAINGTFDELSAILESRRSQLLKEAESKCGGDQSTVSSQKKIVDTAVLSLEGALGFTGRVLELQGVSDREYLCMTTRAIASLREFDKTTWDSDAVEKVQSTTQKFVVGDYRSYVQQIGRIEEQVRPLQLAIQNLPANIDLGRKREFKITSQTPKTKQFATLRRESMDVRICYGKSNKANPLYPQKNPDGSWTVCFTPICGGVHTVVVSLKGVQSLSSHFEYKTTVMGIPSVGARVRRGPDWSCNSEDGGEGQGGIVNSNDYSPDEALYVIWDNGNGYSYAWGNGGGKYQVELMLVYDKRNSNPHLRPRLTTK